MKIREKTIIFHKKILDNKLHCTICGAHLNSEKHLILLNAHKKAYCRNCALEVGDIVDDL